MRSGLALLALLGAWYAGASVALPDLARGLEAVQRGDVGQAESDLLPLADQGYPDAQRALARLYAAQDTPDAAAKAAQWYRVAVEQDPAMRLPLARSLLRTGPLQNPAELERLLQELVRDQQPGALALQLRFYREYPTRIDPTRAALIAQRVAGSTLIEERSEAIAWYRDNRGEPAYVQALIALCEKDRKAVEECYPDLARHFREVADTGALGTLRKETLERFGRQHISPETLERIARHLSADDLPGAPRPEIAYALLAKIQNPAPSVVERKARLLIAQPNLDTQIDARALLQQAYAQGSAEAALQLGRLYLDELNPSADPRKAAALLEQAAQTLPSAHTWLGRLYERGYLGQPDPAQALRHYLVAARAGFPNADFALARMYRSNRGVRVDVVQAYTFAKLAEHRGHPAASAFIAELLQGMTQAQIEQGKALAERELAARDTLAAPAAAAAHIATAENAIP